MARVLAILLLISVCSLGEAKQLQTRFADYMQKFGKSYGTQDEFQTRLNNFEASLKRIELLNGKAKSARFALNKFSDMSPQDFKENVLMKNPIDPSKKRMDVEVLKPKITAVPTSLDWRTHGLVTPVKDQGQCGSCWAFSVTENIESMWIKAGRATNATVNLSEQQIVDCDSSDGGCEGGNPETAYAYVIGSGGQESNRDYPYTAQDGSCHFKSNDIVAKISSWKYATSDYDEKTLQQNLVSWGPLSVCVDAANWQDYQSGVMTWEECAWINVLDHCVQLVGYQTKSKLGDYWIVRNSWGTDWGVDGYIWLSMGSDTCGIAHEATCSVV